MEQGAENRMKKEWKIGKFGGARVAGEEAGREGAEVAPPAGQLLLVELEARYFLRVRR